MKRSSQAKQRDEEEDLEEEAPKGKGRSRSDEDDVSDAVDFDDSSVGGGDPKFPACTVDLELQSCRLYWGDNPDIPGNALMFEATFKIYNVVDMPEALDDEEYGEDEDRPPPVRKGEIRMWRTKVGPKDKQGKPPKGQARARDLLQALLRFKPRSKNAESAVDSKGKKFSWNQCMLDARGEDNELAGQKVRGAFTRIITRRGKGHPMIVPSWSVPDDIEERENNKVDSL